MKINKPKMPSVSNEMANDAKEAIEEASKGSESRKGVGVAGPRSTKPTAESAARESIKKAAEGLTNSRSSTIGKLLNNSAEAALPVPQLPKHLREPMIGLGSSVAAMAAGLSGGDAMPDIQALMRNVVENSQNVLSALGDLPDGLNEMRDAILDQASDIRSRMTGEIGSVEDARLVSSIVIGSFFIIVSIIASIYTGGETNMLVPAAKNLIKNARELGQRIQESLQLEIGSGQTFRQPNEEVQSLLSRESELVGMVLDIRSKGVDSVLRMMNQIFQPQQKVVRATANL